MALLKSLNHKRSSLVDKVRIAGRLSLPDWLALFEAWWYLLVFHVLLRWMSYESLSGLVRKPHRELILPPNQLDLAARLGRMVAISSRLHLLKITCLVRAFTLTRMLSRRGIPARLCIGANKRSSTVPRVLGGSPVDRSGDGIQAHAWVEVQGQPIAESGNLEESFQLLVSARHSAQNNSVK